VEELTFYKNSKHVDLRSTKSKSYDTKNKEVNDMEEENETEENTETDEEDWEED
jgi:hypothetical protein